MAMLQLKLDDELVVDTGETLLVEGHEPVECDYCSTCHGPRHSWCIVVVARVAVAFCGPRCALRFLASLVKHGG